MHEAILYSIFICVWKNVVEFPMLHKTKHRAIDQMCCMRNQEAFCS